MSIGALVGAVVPVGAFVGALVGELVGASVGALVGVLVDALVGASVGARVAPEPVPEPDRRHEFLSANGSGIRCLELRITNAQVVPRVAAAALTFVQRLWSEHSRAAAAAVAATSKSSI